MQKLSIRSRARSEMIDITGEVQRAFAHESSSASACLVFVPHTTAAVTINENSDPAVRADILAELDKAIPHEDGYLHDEGNSAAHIKAGLIGSSVTVPVESGRLCLGTWQAIFFCEFDGPRQRQAWVQAR